MNSQLYINAVGKKWEIKNGTLMWIRDGKRMCIIKPKKSSLYQENVVGARGKKPPIGI